ncbi:MAG: tetratricopeptide repeat protein [Candidatus Kapaibacteriota bacterium]
MKQALGISFFSISLIIISMSLFSGCASTLPETQITTSNKRIVKPLPSFFRSKPLPLSRADSTRMAGIVLDYFIQATDHYLNKEYDDALKIYQRILHLDTSAMVFYSMGNCYFKMQQTDRAIEFMEKAIALDSNLLAAREALADFYVEHEQFDKALSAFMDLERFKPNDIVILYALAGLTEYLYPEQSDVYFNILANITEFKSDIVKRYGMLLVRLNKEQEYIELMKNNQAIHPDNAMARAMLIEGYQLYGHVDEAMQAIEDFLPTSLDEELDEYYQSLLMTILLSNDTINHAAGIERHLSQLKEFKTSSWIVTISCALLAEQANLSLLAEHFHERALSMADSSNMQESIGLAMELLRIDERSLFTSHCTRYASKYPKQSRFSFLLGIKELQDDNLDDAMIYMKDAINRDKKDADAWGELAGIHDRFKQYRESDSCFKQALQIDSLNASFNNNFAYALSERNTDLNEALRMSLIAVSQYPDNPSYLDTYGWIQYKLGNTEAALKILQKALEQDLDRNGVVNYHLSVIYHSQSNTEKALEHIAKALEIKDDPEYKALQVKLQSP